MQDNWIADRMRKIELSGIRKIFELGQSLNDPVDLSIGQPHFDVPDPIKAAAHAAIDAGIPNGHDDPRGFDAETFGNSLTLLMEKLHGPEAAQAAPQ